MSYAFPLIALRTVWQHASFCFPSPDIASVQHDGSQHGIEDLSG